MLRLQLLCAAFLTLASLSVVVPTGAVPIQQLARGDGSTGSAGKTSGGSVTNTAGPDGTITNTRGLALGGAGGTSTVGEPTGDNVSAGHASDASGGDVTNTGGTINNDGASSIGGAGGTSTTPDVTANDGGDDEDNNDNDDEDNNDDEDEDDGQVFNFEDVVDSDLD